MKTGFPRLILIIAWATLATLTPLAHGDVLDKWTSAQFTTNTFSLGSVTFGKGRYVAVGSVYEFNSGSDFGVICTSENGLNWTVRHKGQFGGPYFPLQLYKVIYDKGLFVAIGYSSTIYTSENGLDWEQRWGGPYATGIYGIASEGPRFVAVGDNGSISNVYVSTDGISWEARKSVTLASQIRPINDVAYGAGGYVAVGGSNTYTSPNGLTWSRITMPDVNALSTVTYGNGIFLAPIGKGTNLVSTGIDLVPPFLTWTTLTNNTSIHFGKIIYGNGLFVTSGYSSALNADVILTSIDGTNWVQRKFQYNRPGNLGGLAFGDRRLVAVGVEFGPGFNFTTTTFLSDPFASLRIENGLYPEISIFGLSGRLYRVDYAYKLEPTNWQTLSTLLLTNSPSKLDDIGATNASRFYRSVLLP